MIENIPRISVLIICYKQEELIKRAIESLLAQKDYIYEICVSDDCSPDRTWEVLKEYDRQYPGLFKLHQNNPNVGIFENIEYTWTMPTGDLIYHLSGDDECGDGWFKTVVDFIKEQDIDYINDRICIYGDFQCRYSTGDSLVIKNDAVLNSTNALKLAFRGKLNNRSACYSINILKRLKKCSQGRSHIAEDAQDRQLQINTDKNFYIPKIGNVYYSFVGVSTHVDSKVLSERAKNRPYALNLFEAWGIKIDENDKKYLLEYCPLLEHFLYTHSVITLFKLLYVRYKSKDSSINDNIDYRSVLFALLRRLPHRKPICW